MGRWQRWLGTVWPWIQWTMERWSLQQRIFCVEQFVLTLSLLMSHICVVWQLFCDRFLKRPLLTVSRNFMNVVNRVLWRMAIILKANKANLFVSSVLCVFWYHSPNILDTPHICNISRLRVNRLGALQSRFLFLIAVRTSNLVKINAWFGAIFGLYAG
jgi:hypothetical protein